MARDRRLRFREVVVRRGKDGRFRKRGKGGRLERITVQTDGKGRVRRGVSIDRRKEVIRTGEVPDTGEDRGMIFKALAKTNVMSGGTLRGAKRIDVHVTMRDRRDKLRRIRFSVDAAEVRKKEMMVLGRILWEMKHRGYRTNYPLEVIPYGRGQRKHGFTATDIGKLERMERVKITVRIKK